MKNSMSLQFPEVRPGEKVLAYEIRYTFMSKDRGKPPRPKVFSFTTHTDAAAQEFDRQFRRKANKTKLRGDTYINWELWEIPKEGSPRRL